MTQVAYYNENDPFAAAWLRNLVEAGRLAKGRVDDRSITEVTADDVRGATRAHFFAGIGGWDLALDLAGWPTDRPVWTGSCPCQPLSDAGAKRGFSDERHLWPVWFELIRAVRPPVIVGEQVASRLGLAWLDLVHADLEGAGYTVRALDLCAAGVGAPHLRQRLWFGAWLRGGRVVDSSRVEHSGHAGLGRETRGGVEHGGGVVDSAPVGREGSEASDAETRNGGASNGSARVMADHDEDGRRLLGEARLHERREGTSGEEPAARDADGTLGDDIAGCGEAGSVADAALVGGGTGRPREPHGRSTVEPDGHGDADGGGLPRGPRPWRRRSATRRRTTWR